MGINDQQFMAELSEDQVIIKNTIREFAENKIKPVIMEYDEEQKFPMELLKELGELGFLGILIPESMAEWA